MAGKLKLWSIIKCLGTVKKYLFPSDPTCDIGKLLPFASIFCLVASFFILKIILNTS